LAGIFGGLRLRQPLQPLAIEPDHSRLYSFIDSFSRPSPTARGIASQGYSEAEATDSLQGAEGRRRICRPAACYIAQHLAMVRKPLLMAAAASVALLTQPS
jgi:hypothetical protein